MPCNFDLTLLQNYLDHETGLLEELIMHEHLLTCPSCRAEMEQLMMLYRYLETPPETNLPEELAQIRDNTIDLWLNESCVNTAGGITREKSETLLKTAGINFPSVLQTAWKSQSVWVNQAVSFVKYIPGAGAAAKGTSKRIKKTSLFAGKALFNTARKIAGVTAGRA